MMESSSTAKAQDQTESLLYSLANIAVLASHAASSVSDPAEIEAYLRCIEAACLHCIEEHS